ncbi:unnamed protein product [Rotaria sordida]|uniref:Uncharacterized protein n=1 Tax=Rotaria sordida TaxID=392033 RepID=A0A815ABH6_9BILA|nr:unnamed protein product [Rotaria sordida]
MYAPPNSGNVAARTAVPVAATIACLACLLFLLAVTIVLALIPVYIPTKTATLSPDTRKSNDVTMYLNAGSTSSGRRKRQTTQWNTLIRSVGGKFGSYGNTLVENGIRKVLQGRKEFGSVTVSSVLVTVESSGRKKRLSLTKRQANTVFVLKALFNIIFDNTCGYACQLNAGPTFKSLLQNNLPSALSLTNVPIIDSSGGTTATISSIPITGVLYLTNIYPRSYPFAAPAARPTVSITTATTSTTTTTTTTAAP